MENGKSKMSEDEDHDQPSRKLLKIDAEDNTETEDEILQEGTILCNVCCLPHSIEECPLINSGIRIADATLPSKAVLTLPDTLKITNDEDGLYRVVAKENFVKGTQFGPLHAPKSALFNPKCLYPLQIFDGMSYSFLDTSDENQCNWMILVPFSHDSDKRNCICYQLQTEIYFTAVADILIGEPLTVGYSPGYCALLQNETTVVVSPMLENDIYTILDDKTGPEISRSLQPDILKQIEKTGSEELKGKHTKGLSITFDAFDQNSYLEVSSELNSISDEAHSSKKSETSISSDSEDIEYDSYDPITTIPSVEMKRQRLTNRVGAVLALDEWKCKFCSEVYDQINNFAAHLIIHYKSVGAAKTEKSRLQRTLNPENAQNETSTVDIDFPTEYDGKNLYVKEELNKVKEDSRVSLPPNPEIDSNLEFTVNVENRTASQLKTIPKYPYFCDLCANKKIFNRAEYIIRHLSKHNRLNYCFICKTTFAERKDLGSHPCIGVAVKPITVEGKQTANRCRFCRKSFQNSKLLKLHLKSRHCSGAEAFHRCGECFKLFCRTETFKNHTCKKVHVRRNTTKDVQQSSRLPAEEEDVSVVYKCVICNETFPRLSILEKHLRTHGCTFACSFCHKGLAHYTVNVHTAICEIVQKFSSNPTQVMKCPKCIEIFDNLDSFRYHVVKHTHPSMCPICNLRFPTNTGMRSHKCCQFQCDGCSQSLDTLIEYKKHIVSSHNEAQYFCFECALPFVTQDGFAGHKGCEVKNEKVKSSRRRFQDGTFICEACGVTYTKWSSLKTHRYTHLAKRFICDTCGKAFHRREILTEHKYVHQDAQFECEHCHKKFKSKRSLDVHIQTHTGIKKFPCPDCDKSFTQKINLMTHQAIHLPAEQKGQHCCKYCDKKFASREYLGTHVEAHEKGKHQICDVCGKAYVKAHLLVQHKKTSHGQQKYSCAFCNLQLRQKHSLSRHLKTRHAELEGTWTQEGYLDSRLTQEETDLNRQGQNDKITEGIIVQDTECSKEVKISFSNGRKQVHSIRAEISDPFMNQRNETEIQISKYIEGSSNEGAMLLVEVEEGEGELVFTMEDSQESTIEEYDAEESDLTVS